MSLPETIKRKAQPYIYVPYTVTMRQMKQPADKGFPQLFAHAEKHGLTITGAPFFNYRRINMEDTLDVEAGLPVAATGPEEGAVKAGTLPAGKFLSVQWQGDYKQLMTVTGVLIGWQRLTQQEFDMEAKADGDHFACRLEIYETDPSTTPDPKDWLTTLAFKLA